MDKIEALASSGICRQQLHPQACGTARFHTILLRHDQGLDPQEHDHINDM